MATLYQKAVDAALLNTWRRGRSVPGLITDKGAVQKKGDSVEIGSKTAATVYTSESMAVETGSYAADTLTVNAFRGTNTAVTVSQRMMMLQGDNNVATQVVRESGGSLQNSIDSAVIDEMLANAATTGAGAHQNLAAAAVTSSMLGTLEASLREQDGIGGGNESLPGTFYLAAPRATAAIKAVSDYVPAQFEYTNGVLGLKVPAMVNGIPYFEHSGVPGGVNAQRQQSAITASAIASNVLTVTVGATEAARWTVGQLVWTDGLTTDLAVGSASAITGISGGDITVALTSANAADNGTSGTLYSGSSMAILGYAPWLFYSDTGTPNDEMVKREANAGWAFQLATYIGVESHAGACRVIHTADS